MVSKWILVVLLGPAHAGRPHSINCSSYGRDFE